MDLRTYLPYSLVSYNIGAVMTLTVWRTREILSEMFCAMLCTTAVQNDAHTHTNYEQLYR